MHIVCHMLRRLLCDLMIKGNEQMSDKSREKVESLKKDLQSIENAAVKGYKAIETGTIGAYKAIENAVVGTYKKIEDEFVDTFLREEGETIEEAKKRINGQLNNKDQEK